MDDVEQWYALINSRGEIDSFLQGGDADADIVRRYVPNGWRLETVDHAELAARLDDAGDSDDLDGIPISSLLHEACMSSGQGLN